MNTFSPHVRREIYERADHRCECLCDKCLINQKLGCHHMIPNTKVNRKIHGNKFIQSKENGKLLCEYCHVNCKARFKIKSY